MDNPFQLFEVIPAYGVFQASVNIRMKPGKAGDVYIYRSTNHGGDWELLNPDAPLVLADGGSVVFADTNLIVGFHDTPYYRGVLDATGGPPSTWEAGPAVAPFSYLTPRQAKLATACIKKETRAISGSKTDGMPAFHIIPRNGGVAIPTYDSETDQVLGPSCPNSDTNGFGNKYVGGYYPPFQTWVKMLAASPISTPGTPEATRENQEADIQLMLLSFPIPEVGHLIVLPQSDRRYAIKNPIKPHYFPGTTIPISWVVTCALLIPGDERYRLEVPALEAPIKQA